MKKNGIFLFVISHLVPEIFKIFVLCKLGTDDVIRCDNVEVKTQSREYLLAMITLHFHLQPQYKYDLFHIHFTLLHYTGKYELTKLTSLPTCGFIAQLVEHRTGIAEVTGSNPVEALIFFRLLLSNCLNWKIY